MAIEYSVQIRLPAVHSIADQPVDTPIYDGKLPDIETQSNPTEPSEVHLNLEAYTPSVDKSPLHASAPEQHQSRAKRLLAIALGAAALAGLGNHSSDTITQEPNRQTPAEERVVKFVPATSLQPTLLTSPGQNTSAWAGEKAAAARSSKQQEVPASAELGFGFFCLLPEPEQPKAGTRNAKSKKMTEKDMGAPIVRINDSMYPWDVLTAAGMHENKIMQSLDVAAKQYKKKGGGYAWHGGGTTQWIEVFEKEKSYTDTKNVMRILGPYLQALTKQSPNTKSV